MQNMSITQYTMSDSHISAEPDCSSEVAISANIDTDNPGCFILVFPQDVWVNTACTVTQQDLVIRPENYVKYSRSDFFQGLEGKAVTAVIIPRSSIAPENSTEIYVFTNGVYIIW